MGSVMDQPRPWEREYNDPDEHVGKSADQIRRERHEHTIEAGIAEVLANATDTINKERDDMPNHGPASAPVPREDAFSASAQLYSSTQNTLDVVSNALEEAYIEQSYWNNRVHDLERTKSLLTDLRNNLSEGMATGQAGGLSNKLDPRIR